MSEVVEKPWTDDQLASDDIGKKDLVTFLQSHSTQEVGKNHEHRETFYNIKLQFLVLERT